ncbi:AhpC/TSA family protein [Roseibacillus persicicus]|nr:AhpC/TSA family protein [Roseibacillus persicicus]
MPTLCANRDCSFPRWMTVTLVAAGIYNLAFGLWTICWPHLWFDWSGMERSRYPELWQSVGMIVGVFGIGYLIAASNPIRHWPIVLVGLLGKILGPLGFAKAIYVGALPLSSAWIIITNDLIWWLPFAAILWKTAQAKVGKPITREEPYTTEEAAEVYQLSTGETLAEASKEQTVVLVFLRHFGCTFTRQILRGLQDLKAEAEANNARLVLVHMLQHGDEQDYLASAQSSPIPRIADPNCELYRAFGLGKGGLFELFGPRVWLRGALSLFKGCGVGHLAGDGLQMPGAFLYRDGAIRSAQPARTASDLPDLPKLFNQSKADGSRIDESGPNRVVI